MTPRDDLARDLAKLRGWTTRIEERRAAADRVGAYIATLEQERDSYKADRDSYDDLLGRKMAERDECHKRVEATEARAADMRRALAAYRSALRSGEPETDALRELGDRVLAVTASKA